MATYLELKQQIEELQAQAEQARKQETADAVAQIKSLMTQYNLTPADLGFTAKAPKATGQKRSPLAPKYRDPETGETWTGRGKPPKWIAPYEDRNQFLIK